MNASDEFHAKTQRNAKTQNDRLKELAEAVRSLQFFASLRETAVRGSIDPKPALEPAGD
jgi:hypothetical protein